MRNPAYGVVGAIVAVAIQGAGCGPADGPTGMPPRGGPNDGDPPGSPEAGAPPVRERLVLALSRVTRWPGGGRELVVRAEDAEGRAPAGDLSTRLRLTLDGNAAPSDVVVRPVALEPGYTGLLVASPGDNRDRQALLAAIRSFVAQRPAEERIALFRWGASVDQIANFTADRGRIAAMAERLVAKDAAGSALPPASAIAAAAADVEEVGGPAPSAMRALVVLGPDELPHAGVAAGAPVRVFLAQGGRTPTEAALRDVSRQIDALAAHAHWTVAMCAPEIAPHAALTVEGADAWLGAALPRALPEQMAMACRPEDIGTGRRWFGERIELVFTPEQRRRYDELVEIANSVHDRDEVGFDVSLRLAPGEELVPAQAHMPARGAMFCERKSYTVTLDGSGRHLLPGSYTDKIDLLSMCDDPHYINHFAATHIAADLGLFPLKRRLVELVLDGETRGVYLLVEKVKEEVRRDNARVRTILRRQHSTAGVESFRVTYSHSADEPAAIASFEGLEAAIAPLAGDELERVLSSRLDLDQYLKWTALNSALRSGDSVDELWLVATETLDETGAVSDWWDFMGWSFESIFSSCRKGASFAFVDPHGMVNCAESRLDHKLFADPGVYDGFVAALETVLRDVSPARFRAAVDQTAAALLPFFERPEICRAMIELVARNPGAVEPAVAQAEIRKGLDRMVKEFGQRRQELETRIAAYHSHP